MLSNTLSTNEVKNAAGTGVSFERVSTVGQTTIFRDVAEVIGFQHRLTISHQRSGDGQNSIRRSLVRFDLTTEDSQTGKADVTSCYCVLQIPERNSGAAASAAKVTAELMSFLASLGASTTILYDGTGNGAKSLLNETL